MCRRRDGGRCSRGTAGMCFPLLVQLGQGRLHSLLYRTMADIVGGRRTHKQTDSDSTDSKLIFKINITVCNDCLVTVRAGAY